MYWTKGDVYFYVSYRYKSPGTYGTAYVYTLSLQIFDKIRKNCVIFVN